MSIAIDIQHVSKAYPAKDASITILNDISLTVRSGEFVVLLGPSGCGKSTLLRMIAGLSTPSAGTITLPGKDLPRTHVGMVFQSYTSFPWLTVRENVAFGPLLSSPDRAAALAIADNLLDNVGLAHMASAYPAQLSGGMQQRLAIARALAVEPAVLLMDEPFGALDALTRMEMQALLTRLWRERGKTVVFVTHDIDEAILLADRIVLLAPHPGRIDVELEVPLARPRAPAIVDTPEFGALRRELRDRILRMA